MHKLHKILGLSFALILLIIAATGCILIFTEELNLHQHSTVEPSAEIIDYRFALANFIESYPGSRIRSIYIPRIAGEAADTKSWLVFMERPEHAGRWVGELDPYAGQIVSEHAYESTLFRWIFALHTGTLFGRLGGVLFWVAAFSLFLSGISGFWIYRKAISKLFNFKFLKRSWRKPVMVHSIVGTWSLVFIILMSATGAFLMYLVVPPKLREATPISPTRSEAIIKLADLGVAHAIVSKAVPQAKIVNISFKFVEEGEPQIIYTLLDRSALPWNKWSRVYLNGDTGLIQSIEQPNEATLYRRFVMTVVTLHFGFYGSELTQSVYFIFGILIFTLPISGLFIWLKRRKRLVA